MGMLIYDALVLAQVSRRLRRKRSVLTLGVPTLNFSARDFWRAVDAQRELFADWDRKAADFSDHAGFFRILGFETIDALDISPYEGANLTGDLNDSSLPARIPRRYDLIYDSGTIEHIFEITTAMRTLDALVDIGGAVVHATPSNGFLDHGFWQVSPDLFRSFYGSRRYRCMTSALWVLGERPYSLLAERNLYRARGRAFIVRDAPAAIAVFGARKEDMQGDVQVGMQDYYKEMHGEEHAEASMEFYIPMGSPRLGRAARFKLVMFFLDLPTFPRRVARKLMTMLSVAPGRLS